MAKPVATADFYTTDEGSTLNVSAPGVLGNDTDFDSANLTVTSHGAADDGSVTVFADGSFTYAPDEGVSGTDAFTYTISDGQASDTAVVTIEVVPPSNHQPVAVNDSYNAFSGKTLSVAAPGVLTNDSDGDDDPLSVVTVSNPANGTLVWDSNGSFEYTPTDDFTGVDTFTYSASDGELVSNAATVTIEVFGGTMHIGDLDPAPVFFGKIWNAAAWVTVHDTNENGVPNATVTVSVDTNDFDPDTAALSCMTSTGGFRCAVAVDVPRKVDSVTFTVTNVAGEPNYVPGDNHDPDGDSDGTTVTVLRP
jgi:hypothetical protein